MKLARRVRTRRGRRRWLAIMAGVFVLCVVGALVLHWRLFMHPAYDSPAEVDAVAVFSGGGGERLAHALEQLASGRSHTLLLNPSTDEWAGKQAVLDLCANGMPDVKVICAVAGEDSTHGEARRYGEVMREHGLDSVMAVTSQTHLTRAKLWLRRCQAGRVSGSGSPIDADVNAYVREWGAVLYGLLIDRNC